MKTKLLKKLLRMSKYAAFSFFLQAVLCTLAFSHDSEAQARNLNEIYLKINIENASLEQAFKEIERSTEFTFAYIPGDLPKKTVTVSGKKKNLEAILMSIAEQSGVSFKRIKTTIHVRKSEDNQRRVTDVAQSYLQMISISGAVTSYEDDEPLPGVNVLIKGSAVGTVTDLQGRYTLEVPGKESVIVFSFIGYTPEEIVVNDRTIIDISLTPDITSLEEVVVVAYGTQKKITTIGAQSSIKTVDLKQPVSNLSNLITGRIAGVVGVQRSGEPGYDNAQIFIRGISSFVNDASAPLVLVDGVERDFNNIDPEDIESFSIMKDASATAVYGVRGGMA